MARAFTLVELLVVIVIIGTIATVAAPALRSRGDAATARALADVYESARGAALRYATEVEVALDLTDGSYHVLGVPRPGAPRDTLRAGTLGLSASVRLSGGRDGWGRARFDPLGRAHADRIIIDEAGVRRELLTDPWTGAVRVRTR